MLSVTTAPLLTYYKGLITNIQKLVILAMGAYFFGALFLQQYLQTFLLVSIALEKILLDSVTHYALIF